MADGWYEWPSLFRGFTVRSGDTVVLEVGCRHCSTDRFVVTRDWTIECQRCGQGLGLFWKWKPSVKAKFHAKEA